jgi:hypothetical protein
VKVKRGEKTHRENARNFSFSGRLYFSLPPLLFSLPFPFSACEEKSGEHPFSPQPSLPHGQRNDLVLICSISLSLLFHASFSPLSTLLCLCFAYRCCDYPLSPLRERSDLCFHNVQLSPLPKHSHNKQTLTTIRAALPLLCIQQTEELFFLRLTRSNNNNNKKGAPEDLFSFGREKSSATGEQLFHLSLFCFVCGSVVYCLISPQKPAFFKGAERSEDSTFLIPHDVCV